MEVNEFIMNKLVVCQKHESLECFLIKARGWECFHAKPHVQEYDSGCTDNLCCFVTKTNLSGCRCTEITKEI
jgi:hypothetical protein